MKFFAHVHQGRDKQYTQNWPTTDGKMRNSMYCYHESYNNGIW